MPSTTRVCRRAAEQVPPRQRCRQRPQQHFPQFRRRRGGGGDEGSSSCGHSTAMRCYSLLALGVS